MDISQDQIDELLAHPSESLNVEIKRWLNPDTASDFAKIVKATQAIRNRNGGFFILGFDDKILQPDRMNSPVDVRGTFHLDKIQAIVSRYSSEPFEITIAFGKREGTEYPVIAVPEGVTAPVVAKRDLQDASGAFLIREGDVYFRTLGANGTPSTARARPSDWREILNICFENREADIGRFLRRHLVGNNVENFLTALTGIRDGVAQPLRLLDRVEALQNEGKEHFSNAIKARTLNKEEIELLDAGSWQVALVIDPPNDSAITDREFLNRFSGANPRLTGWPVWLDSRNFSEKLSHPHVVDKAWQALIVSAKGWSSHLDFIRLNPKGKFYLERALQDDLVPSKIPPKTVLDPILVLIRVAEAIAVGISVARALGWDDNAHLGFGFKWTKLSGRALESWANPMISVLPGSVAHDDEAETFVEVPGDTPISAIAPYVEKATRELFLKFDGHSVLAEVIERWAKRLIERRLNG